MQRALPFAGVYLVLFLIGAETFLVSPLLPTIADDLGEREAVVATTVTAYTLAYALSAPFLSPVFDAYPRRTAIGVGTVLFLVGNVLAAVAGGIVVLVGARVVGALGAAIAGPAIWAHLSERAPSDAQGRMIGLGLAAFSAGTALGVPAASLAAGTGGWRAAFAVLAVASAAALPLVWWQARPSHGEEVRAQEGRPSTFAVWRDPALRSALAVVFLLQGANLGAYTFLGAVLDDHFDLSVTTLGLVGVLVGVGGAAGSLVAGRIGDSTRNERSWLAVWSAVLALGVVVAVWASVLPLAALAVLVWFFASGAFTATAQTLLVSVRPDLAAISSSWNTALLYAGAAAGVAIIQALPDRDVAVTLVGGGLALAAAALARSREHVGALAEARS
ncbi:MFS transporter [Conexibacter woesei]|uniref:MFS transporter n=1 Tax=Conexibacter woesei TaxID=191495 RepID=UPI0003FBC603|nr:MFS transporter [Conexibacter woesei]